MAHKLSLKSHKPIRKDGALKGYEVTPIARLREGDNPAVFVQSGKFYDEGGNPIEEDKVPPWVHDHIKMMSPDAREKHGFQRRMAAKPHASVAKD